LISFSGGYGYTIDIELENTLSANDWFNVRTRPADRVMLAVIIGEIFSLNKIRFTVSRVRHSAYRNMLAVIRSTGNALLPGYGIDGEAEPS
jgi:hypothetical protein